MQFEERALSFSCEDSWLYGILGQPSRPHSRGIVIVVGGPQYRAGSHRQFTLLARELAAAGFPVLRFDYRGMGDSEGYARTFESVNDDLRCAIDKLIQESPGVKEIVIWGLCDGASAALFYAHTDRRVKGLILANPWVRTEEGIAKATLKHYYRARLIEPELWRKVLTGRFDYFAAGRSFLRHLGKMLGNKSGIGLSPLPDRMLEGWHHFHGSVLLLLSGNDLTAKEFKDLIQSDQRWRKLAKSRRTTCIELAEANHTFARRIWRDQVAGATTEWLQAW